jgi:hypothetical protein
LIRNGGSKYHGGSIYHTGGGAQFSIRGFNIPWMKIDPRVNLPWGSKYHMTPGSKKYNNKLKWFVIFEV